MTSNRSNVETAFVDKYTVAIMNNKRCSGKKLLVTHPEIQVRVRNIMMADAQTILLIIGRAERLQLEIYPESGCVRSCYSYQTEILNSWYAKCPCNEEFTVLEKCGVIFTGQTHLSKGNSPFNLVDTLSIFQFPFWNKHGHPVQCSSKHAKEQERLLFRP